MQSYIRDETEIIGLTLIRLDRRKIVWSATILGLCYRALMPNSSIMPSNSTWITLSYVFLTTSYLEFRSALTRSLLLLLRSLERNFVGLEEAFPVFSSSPKTKITSRLTMPNMATSIPFVFFKIVAMPVVRTMVRSLGIRLIHAIQAHAIEICSDMTDRHAYLRFVTKGMTSVRRCLISEPIETVKDIVHFHILPYWIQWPDPGII